MENSDNVVSIRPGAANLGRRIWNFRYPHEVVRDCSMSVEEKRAILAAWASDVHAVEALPTLRHLPGTPSPVTFSSIMDARAQLDRQAGSDDDDPPPLHPSAARKPLLYPRQEAA